MINRCHYSPMPLSTARTGTAEAVPANEYPGLEK